MTLPDRSAETTRTHSYPTSTPMTTPDALLTSYSCALGPTCPLVRPARAIRPKSSSWRSTSDTVGFERPVPCTSRVAATGPSAATISNAARRFMVRIRPGWPTAPLPLLPAGLSPRAESTVASRFVSIGRIIYQSCRFCHDWRWNRMCLEAPVTPPEIVSSIGVCEPISPGQRRGSTTETASWADVGRIAGQSRKASVYSYSSSRLPNHYVRGTPMKSRRYVAMVAAVGMLVAACGSDKGKTTSAGGSAASNQGPSRLPTRRVRRGRVGSTRSIPPSTLSRSGRCTSRSSSSTP